VSREVELEAVTDALVLTPNDDFNALAAAELRTELGHGHVFRIAPEPEVGALLAPIGEDTILGRDELTFEEFNRRLAEGGHVGEFPPDGAIPLFVITPVSTVRVATGNAPPRLRPGDRLIALA
jgi:hypothetical protein